jgi:hypothetical protein
MSPIEELRDDGSILPEKLMDFDSIPPPRYVVVAEWVVGLAARVREVMLPDSKRVSNADRPGFDPDWNPPILTQYSVNNEPPVPGLKLRERWYLGWLHRLLGR